MDKLPLEMACPGDALTTDELALARVIVTTLDLDVQPDEIAPSAPLYGEGLGLDSADLYKRLKLIRDIDDIIVETAPFIEANRLDLDTVRNALAFEFGAKGV